MLKAIRKWWRMLGWHLQTHTPGYQIFAYSGSMSRGGNTAWFIRVKDAKGRWVDYGFYSNSFAIVDAERELKEQQAAALELEQDDE